MATKLKNMRLTKVALVDAGANQEADILIYKRATEPQTTEGAPVADEISKQEHDDLAAQLAEAQATLTALDSMSPEELAALKGFEIAKADQTDELEQAKIAKADLEKRVEKMERERRVESFVRKARDDFGDLAPADELGAALEEVERVAPDAYKALDGVLKAVAARAETSLLFKELGGSGGDLATPAELAKAEIKKRVDAGEPIEKAQRAVFSEHPDWYPSTESV